MAMLKFRGVVKTNKVGSECSFEFEVDEEGLPDGPPERSKALNDAALEALWESGQVEWDYEQIDEET